MTGRTSDEIQAGSRPDSATGIAYFAATLLIMAGAFQVIQGIVALAKDTFYVVGAEYVFQLDITLWGWIQLLLGILLIVVGVFLFLGATWARWSAVVLAVVSAVTTFMWLPHYPVWSVLVIAVDVAVIWALTAHGRAIDDALRNP